LQTVELAETIAALPQPAIRTDKVVAVRGFGRPTRSMMESGGSSSASIPTRSPAGAALLQACDERP
jgi:hypothetical protein